MQTRNFSYNILRITKEIPCVCLRCYFGWTKFLNIPLFTFIHTLLSLKYYAPETRSIVNICHIILTPVPCAFSYIWCNANEPSFVSLSVKWYICLSRDSNPLSQDPEALSWTKHVDQSFVAGLFDENDQYNEHIPCVVVVCSGLTSLSTIFQSYDNGVWLRQGNQCSLLLCCVTEVSCPRHLT